MPQISIETIIKQAKVAQTEFESAGQEVVDELITGLAWALLEPGTNRSLSNQAIHDTGMGNADDKFTKNHRKTLGLLRDLKNAPSVGVIKELPEKGLVEIARPVGVVGAVTPSTNPIATPLNNTLNAIKGRNSIILAPSPKGDSICELIVEILQKVLVRLGHPQHLIQKIPSPASKEATNKLMQSVDLVVVTGSEKNVSSAYRSGTPAIGVGVGNVAVIIDETADLSSAASKVVTSKTFDNATSCSSENSLVIVDEVYENAIEALQEVGGVLLDHKETQELKDNLWIQGKLNPHLIAKSASEVATVVGFQRPEMRQAKMLMVEETGTGSEHPFSGEKLSPVLTLYRAENFKTACQRIIELYEFQGKGHSVGLHSKDETRPVEMGLKLPACRVIVNQPHCLATGGSFGNGMPFSLSMGCGTWGRNSISDNLNYRHFLNIVRVVQPVTPVEPSEEEIFGDFWEKYGR
jgi:sulfoacetaldehyde dehydrogenase